MLTGYDATALRRRAARYISQSGLLMLICAGGINEREGGWGRKRRGRLPRRPGPTDNHFRRRRGGQQIVCADSSPDERASEGARERPVATPGMLRVVSVSVHDPMTGSDRH